MEKILVGKVTKPQALKGEFRIKPEIIDFKAFKKFTAITIAGKEYKVEHVSLRPAFVIVKVEGVNSCEEAENLRNSDVFAEFEIEVSDTFSYVNFTCFLDNEIGRVVDVNNYGSTDIITIKGDKEIMIPVIDGLITKVDADKKEIYFDKEIFSQVASYEDWYFNIVSRNVWAT